MPQIECIEEKGDTSPKDFTLHDAGHAFRVADWIVRITPADVFANLSQVELTMLLLAAYLHDVGMSPEWRKVEGHYRYLFDSSSGGLTRQELLTFQLWLAEREGLSFRPPIQNVGRLHELLTHYCRARHNDWGAEWITRHLPIPGLYVGWRDDLINLCRSHHHGYDELIRAAYDVRRVEPGQLLHRRFLAALLRVADILENDPERTPAVLLRHRSISKSSELHWVKTSVMHQELVKGQLVISAEPTTALMHRAIEDTVDAIDAELRLCDRLSREFPFGHDPASGGGLPYRWDLSPTCVRHIQPSEGRYEYIPGSFRPDTARLLRLLTGSQLYTSNLAAARELIQNAFDSINEQVAREQILQNRPDPGFSDIVAAKHAVELRFEVGEQGSRLICKDTGVGMSKSIIRDRLLVSGGGPGADHIELQLACRSAGIGLIRSGQFGIGVLSYFLLSDHMIFQTRRSQEAGSAEGNGWEFETWGAGGFGELRRCNKNSAGTTVRLELRDDVMPEGGPARFYRDLLEYIRGILAWLPCRFTVTSNLADAPTLCASRGWFVDHSGLIKRKIAKLFRGQERKQVIDSLRLSVIDEDLPDSMGRVRLCIPWFRTALGACPAHIFVNADGALPAAQFVDLYLPKQDKRYSWCGISPDGHQSEETFPTIEVDLRSQSAGSPTVNRDGLRINSRAQSSIDTYVEKRLNDLRGSLWGAGTPARLASIISVIESGFAKAPLYWPVRRRGGGFSLREVPFPATTQSMLPDRISKLVGCRIGKERIAACGVLRDRDSGREFGAFDRLSLPDRCFPTRQLEFCPVWDSTPSNQTHRRVIPSEKQAWNFALVRLPAAWKDLLACDLEGIGPRLVNRDHPLVVDLTSELEKLLKFNDDDFKVCAALKRGANDAIASAPAARRWLLRMLLHPIAVYQIWDELLRRNSGQIARLWEVGFKSIGNLKSVLRLTNVGGDDDDSTYPVLEEISPRGQDKWRANAETARLRFRRRLSAPPDILTVIS